MRRSKIILVCSCPVVTLTALGPRFAEAEAQSHDSSKNVVLSANGGFRTMRKIVPKELSVDEVLPEALPAIRKEMEELQLAEGGDDAEATTYRPASKVTQCFQ
jgi:hypothetical protein